jgi:hypothetical protein
MAAVLDRRRRRQEHLALRLEEVGARLGGHQVADFSGGPGNDFSDLAHRPLAYARRFFTLHQDLPK